MGFSIERKFDTRTTPITMFGGSKDDYERKRKHMEEEIRRQREQAEKQKKEEEKRKKEEEERQRKSKYILLYIRSEI